MARHTEAELWAIAERELTPKQLEAARLVWRRGLSHRQAGHMLGITRHAIRDRLRAATARIAQHTERKAA